MSRTDKKSVEDAWQHTHNLYVTYESAKRQRDKEESKRRDEEYWKKFKEDTHKLMDKLYERWGNRIAACITEATPDYVIFEFVPYPGAKTYHISVSLEYPPGMFFGGNEWGMKNEPSWVFKEAYAMEPRREVHRLYFRDSASEAVVAHDLYTGCLSVLELPRPELEYWK